MTRKRACVLFLGFVIAVIAFSLWVYLETHKVTRGNFDRIRVGMTEDQVRDLLGGSKNGTIMAPKNATGYHRLYSGRGCKIMVYFNPAGEVEDMDFEQYPTTEWYQWLKTLFGL